MVEIFKTNTFKRWMRSLRGSNAVPLIAYRIECLAMGEEGDCKLLGSGLRELRIHHGPGYRIYYTWRSGALIILLSGGDKSSQTRDIAHARKLMNTGEPDA